MPRSEPQSLVDLVDRVELWQSAEQRDPVTRVPLVRGAAPLASAAGRTVKAPATFGGCGVLCAFARDGTELARWELQMRPGETVSVAQDVPSEDPVYHAVWLQPIGR